MLALEWTLAHAQSRRAVTYDELLSEDPQPLGLPAARATPTLHAS